MSQEPTHARFFSDAVPADSIHVHSVTGKECLGKPWEYDVVFATTETQGLSSVDLLDQPAALVFLRGRNELRTIRGVVAEVEDLGQTESAHITYRVRLVPRAWAMTLNTTLDVHLDVSVPDIVKSKLLLAGVGEESIEPRLQGTYPAREFVVQYKESDLAFSSRLLEHWGITLLFEDGADDARVVITDHNDGFGPLFEDRSPVAFERKGDHVGVHDLRVRSKPIPKRFVVRDYNYRTPLVDLWATESADGPGAGRDAVEYGTHFKTVEEGAAFARIRSEEARCRFKTYEGKSGIPEMRAGARFLLEGHPAGDVELLVVEVRHKLVQAALGGLHGESGYANEFVAIPANMKFRPARETPIPKVAGVLTGRVEASAKGDYAELDDDGRYKIRFLFDAAERGAAQASRPVRMIQPHSGPGYGMHFPMRAGIEVALTFVDGDPDRPVIVGAVPNAATGSPVTAGNNTHNVMKTGGGNLIDIDDQEDGQRIKLGTPRLNTVFQLGAPNAPEDGAVLSTLGNSSTVANTSISGITALSTSVTLLQKLNSAGDLINFASKPSKFDKALMTLSLIDTVASLGSASCDIAQKVMATMQAEKQAKADTASFTLDEKSSAVTGATATLATAAENLAGNTSLPQATRDAISAALAAWKAAKKELDDAAEPLSKAQEAYSTLKRKQKIGDMSLEGDIVAKRTELIDAWGVMLKAQEKLDGDTTAPGDTNLEPCIHTDVANDKAKDPPESAAKLKKASVFSSAGGDASVDVVVALKAAFDLLADPAKSEANGYLTAATKAIAAQGEAQTDYASKKREADDEAFRNANSTEAKNWAKASLFFNGVRTADTLISAFMGFANLAKSSEEQIKNNAVWGKLSGQLSDLGMKTMPTPGLKYKPGEFCPAIETTNLNGSAGSLGLYAYERAFFWSPRVAVFGDDVVIATGDVPESVVDPTAVPLPGATVAVPKPVAIYMEGLTKGTMELRAAEEIQTWTKKATFVATASEPGKGPLTAFARIVMDQAEKELHLTQQNAADDAVEIVLTTKTNPSAKITTENAAKKTEMGGTEGALTLKGSETIDLGAGDKAKLSLAKAEAKVELTADGKGTLTMGADSTVVLNNDKNAEIVLSASDATMAFGKEGLVIDKSKTELSGKKIDLVSQGMVQVNAKTMKVGAQKVLLG